MQKETGLAVGIILFVLGATFFFLWPKTSRNELDTTEVVESSTAESAQVPVESTDMTKAKPTPKMMIDSSKKYQAVLTTSVGAITIDLNAKATPITVNNFVTLAKSKFYDKTIFHRVINGFMIQGGDPTGTGMGGPGYKFDDEKFEGEYVRGTVAMANAGPNTNGSQFFIMHGNTPLPKNYIIFGTVSSGLETVDKIATAPVKPGGEGSSPVDPVQITKAEIIEK